MRYFLGLIAFTLCLNLFAQETKVSLRTYVNSCGYVSKFSADVKASLIDPSLPDDAEVKFIYGLGNKDERLDWQRISEVKTKKRNQGRREVEISVILAERGKSWHFNTLQFVWQITLSSGEIYFIKGNTSPLDFFEAVFTSIHHTKCIGSSKDKPLYQEADFSSVSR